MKNVLKFGRFGTSLSSGNKCLYYYFFHKAKIKQNQNYVKKHFNK